MKKVLKFSFVSHYYNNHYEFISRLIEFIKDYYRGIFKETQIEIETQIHPLESIPKKRMEGEVFFGEVVPVIFEPHTLTYNMNDHEDENVLMDLVINESNLIRESIQESEECINVIFYHYV
jgi:hypothetical protein